MEVDENGGNEIYLRKDLAKRFPELQSMVALVTCPICYDVVKEPLTTTVDRCWHTFCSICVRGYLAKFKQQCPECLVELHDRDLLVNRPLKSLAHYLQSFIPKVQDMMVSRLLEQNDMNDNEQNGDNCISSHSTKKLSNQSNLETAR